MPSSSCALRRARPHERGVLIFKDTQDPRKLLESVEDAVPEHKIEWCIKAVATELCLYLGEGEPRPIKAEWIFEAYVKRIKEYNEDNGYTPYIMAFLRDAILPVFFEWAHDPLDERATFDTVVPVLYFCAGGGGEVFVSCVSCFFHHIGELTTSGVLWLSKLLKFLSTSRNELSSLVTRNEVIAMQSLRLLSEQEGHVTLLVHWWLWLDLEHTSVFWSDAILVFMAFSMKLPLEHDAQVSLYELLARACGVCPYAKAKVRLMLWDDMIRRHRFPRTSLPLVRTMMSDRVCVPRETILAWRKEVTSGTTDDAWSRFLRATLGGYDSEGHFSGIFVDRHGITKRKRISGKDDAWVARNFAVVAKTTTPNDL